MKSLLLSAVAALSLSTAALADDPPSSTPATPPATTPAAAPKTMPASSKKPETFHVANGKSMHKAAAHTKMVAVDLNTASKDDLMKVKGITDSMADKIIQDRPFTNKHDLVTKQIMTQAEYGKVKSLVMVKTAPAPKKP